MVDLHDKWEAEGGREAMYFHPYLTPDSIVLEIGAYKGLWASEISKKYDPYIYAFEPVPEFYEEATKKLAGRTKVGLFNFGLGARDENIEIFVNGDASGIGCLKGNSRMISIRHIGKILCEKHLFTINIDLAQINCEGGEYELLEEMLSQNLITKFDHLQIQFHDVVPEAKRKMENIFERLSVTHQMHYNYNFIFCCWSKK